MTQSIQSLQVLHLVLSITETSAAYNEHCLPVANKRDISICTYFKTDISPPPEITLFQSDGSLAGFFRTLKTALQAKSYDVIHAHAPHFGLLLMAAALKFGNLFRSTVFTVHNSYQNIKFRNRLLLFPVFALAKKVVCCSEASLESFPRFLKHLAGDSLCCVQNGVDLDRITHDGTSGINQQREDSLTIVSINRLIKIKNPVTVLHAFQQSATTSDRLVFIGEGKLRVRILEERDSFDLTDQVELTGLIPRSEVYRRLRSADVFVSASYGEGLPVAVLEAMACGCPVILSDIPPHREIAKRVDFIPLFQPDNVATLVREIKHFKQLSLAQRTAIGMQCKELAQQRFSLNAMHDGYLRVYQQVVA